MLQIESIAGIIEKLRRENPLVHNITNVVVTNFTANGLLALGASPVMANAKEEVADMAKLANALVLNIGTLDERIVESMIIAGKSANEHQIPVILDPVGAGATPYRTESARKLVKEVKVSILRGNAAEVANVIGENWTIKGVDSGNQNGDIVSLAKTAAKKLDLIVVITGKVDVVSDGVTTYLINNGHELLTKVTGAGCLLSSVIGAFSAVESDLLLAAVSALTSYGVAAQLAVEASGADEPGSFQIQLLNKLYSIRTEDIMEHGAIDEG